MRPATIGDTEKGKSSPVRLLKEAIDVSYTLYNFYTITVNNSNRYGNDYASHDHA